MYIFFEPGFASTGDIVLTCIEIDVKVRRIR